MITNAKFLSALILILLLAACAPSDAQEPAPLSPTEAAQPTATQVAATQPPSPTAPTSSIAAATDSATELAPEATAGEPSAPTATAKVAAEDPPDEDVSEETAVAVNGRSEDGAYFLGRVDAPVTIIDYSDFL